MKTPTKDMQIETARLSEGMRLIFDQEALSSSPPSSSRSGSRSSGRSNRSASRARPSSRRPRKHSHRRSSRSSSSSSGSSASSGPSRSRSHPRCHRRSERHCCGRNCRSPPRRYRARSRSYSPSPDKSHHSSRRYRRSSTYRSHRARSRSDRRQLHHGRYRSRSRSATPDHRRQHRGRFPDAPRRSPRSYRSRSRTPERSSVHFSQEEKRELLKIAAENAEKMSGAERLVFSESLKSGLRHEGSVSKDGSPSSDRSTPVHSKLVSPEPESRQSPKQVSEAMSGEDDELSPRTSPKRKPITFSINNAVAKPTITKPHGMSEVKVTPRVDIVGSKKPYGQWITVKTTSSRSSKQ